MNLLYSDGRDLYCEDNEEYRNTPPFSNIPPPEISRARSHLRRNNNDRYNNSNEGFYNPRQRERDGNFRDKQDREGHFQTEKRKEPIENTQYFPHEQQVDFLKYEGEPMSDDYPYAHGLKFSSRDTKPDCSLFCDEEIVNKLQQAKSRFDTVPTKHYLSARTNANGYEAIGNGIFHCRAAMKMANLDFLYGLTARHLNQKESPFFFCDLCSGPGGFAEYILWRKKKDNHRGWGFVLKNEEDDRLNTYPSLPNFSYFMEGAEGTANICSNTDIKTFCKIINKGTNNEGVSLVVADGGMSIDKEELSQEYKVRQLVLCEFLTMFSVLKKGGDFVCKLFDAFLPFTVGLLYILYRNFEKISIVKPYASRPANSERYVIATNLLSNRPELINYLFNVNERMSQLKPNEDVYLIIPLNQFDKPFMAYIRESNTKIANQQLESLDMIYKYLQEPELLPVDKAEVRRRCLRLWRIPDHLNFDEEDYNDDPDK
eukprot:TRINITY_DN2588_c0_g2_i3.p1 TRINITY_DN2588_c0_g2~~TRINITY_DN2588_c0_g2_i3.p1  ORF type:complete len:485 (+),score=102.70 TRINITY_DN2588_c0_g2_i3:135-1589(+)